MYRANRHANVCSNGTSPALPNTKSGTTIQRAAKEPLTALAWLGADLHGTFVWQSDGVRVCLHELAAKSVCKL